MRLAVLHALLVTLALILTALAGGAMSPALGASCGDGVGPCRCGDVVIAHTTLGGTDPILKTRCPCDGLLVAAGVTLEIGGIIRAEAGNRCSGIRFAPGTTNAGVKIGRIIGFDTGVDADGVTGVRISRLLINDSGTWGILVDGDHNHVESNVVARSGLFGIDVVGARNEVRLNRTETSGIFGMIVNGRDSVVSRNQVLRSGFDGLVILGDHATVDRNTCRDNGGSGVVVDGGRQTVTLNVADSNGFDGFTVFASLSTFTRNRSRDNGDLGILDFAGDNVYAGNLCKSNGLGASDPPGLCF